MYSTYRPRCVRILKDCIYVYVTTHPNKVNGILGAHKSVASNSLTLMLMITLTTHPNKDKKILSAHKSVTVNLLTWMITLNMYYM